jgi:hypothetical protein
MKNNLTRLHALLRIFGERHFYHCEATASSATCMGKFNSELLLKALKYRFKMEVSSNGFIWLRRGNYSITLTD